MTPQTTLCFVENLPARGLAETPLRDWPAGERPLDRLYNSGPMALSDVELLAVILGAATRPNPVTVAQELLTRAGSFHGLQQLGLRDLEQLPGIGHETAGRIKSALEIARRLLMAQYPDRLQISSPGDAAQLLMVEMAHLDQEQLRVVLLDTRNRLQAIHTVYIGSLNSSMVRVGEVFKEAIRRNSAAIIVVHNHPSGDPTPSPEDMLVTRQIIEAGKLLDCDVLDHLIIGQGRWVSMRERGLAFSS